MPSLRTELNRVLEELGAIEPIALGSSKRRSFSSADKERVAQVISAQQRFNSRLLALAVTMLVSIFLLGVFLVIYYINRPAIAVVALGGNLFSLLLTVSWMRRLWIEKGVVDLARIATEEMSPEEAIKLACTLYFNLLAQKTETSQATRGRPRATRSQD